MLYNYSVIVTCQYVAGIQEPGYGNKGGVKQKCYTWQMKRGLSPEKVLSL